MAMPPVRAILVVGFNILRQTCRRYGAYVCVISTVLFIYQYSGFKNVQPAAPDADHLIEHQHRINELTGKQNLEEELAFLESQIDDKGAKFNGAAASDVTCPEMGQEAVSAYKRASSETCKKLIANITCQVAVGNFYPQRLVSYCPSHGQVRGRYLGCYSDDRNNRLLRGHVSQQQHNSPLLCTDHCYTRGYVLAGLQYSKECFCGNEEVSADKETSDSACDMPCPGSPRQSCGGYLAMSLYQTGLAKPVTPSSALESSEDGQAEDRVRVAYILTLNGRAVRQLHRLFRALYHSHHYFYLHVDVRSSLMQREAEHLASLYDNVFVTHERHATIWGGASLLTVLLQAMRHLISHQRHWQFVINLSESDYPIKTNAALEAFLWWNRGRNFLKSHGQDTNKFLRKQGLDRSFVQCDNHMWRLGERALPRGVRMDGGSDWLCLNRDFVQYVVGSQDQLVRGLLRLYNYTLLPAESFFHTVLRNSAMCHTFTDNNLHLTNWRRLLGCRCQYKHIVDWCGCSPNDFLPKDFGKLQATSSRNLFFARKFEAVQSLSIVNTLDTWLYGPYRDDTPSLESYWENRYHHLDAPEPGLDVLRTLYWASTLMAAQHTNHLLQAQQSERLAGSAGGKLKSSRQRLSGQSSSLAETANDRRACSVTPKVVLQAHSYHSHDAYKGSVVEAAVEVEDEGLVRLEAWLAPLAKTTLPSASPLQNIEVGSEFDLKEQMFRNFEGALGPMTNLTIALQYSAAFKEQLQALKDDQERSATSLVVVVVAPDNVLAAALIIVVDTADTHQLVLPHLKKPLLPGLWRVLAISEGRLAGHVTFPVLPLAFWGARPISPAEARELLEGPPGGDYSLPSSRSPHTPASPDLYTDVLLAHRIVLANASSSKPSAPPPSGDALDDWILSIVRRGWSLSSVCLVDTGVASSAAAESCLFSVMQRCSQAPWSSHYPDPKADLTDPDPDTGYLRDPYRLRRG